MTTKAQLKHLETVKNELREIIKPHDTIYTKVCHVSRSGMYRVINMYIMINNAPRNIDYLASQLLEGYDNKHDGCKTSGCGMDMGFHLVYNLSYILFHDNPDYARSDAGYALNQRWL